MSIGKMDWSNRNSNGTLAHPNGYQYLPQSTSSTVSTIPSHTTSVPPNSYSTAVPTFTSGRNNILKGLLGAQTPEQLLKIQQSALLKTPGQQSTQISQEQYNAIYNSLLLHKMSFAANHQSSPNIQTVVPNYQMQVYPNAAHTFQQAHPGPIVQQQQQAQPGPMVQEQQQAQPGPIVQQQAQLGPIVVQQQQAQMVQCYSNNAYNIGNVQQSAQSTQSDGYTPNRTQQRVLKTYPAKRSHKNVQATYTSIAPQPNTIDSTSIRGSAPFVASYVISNDRNVPVSTSNYQNVQSIGSNYHTISLINTLQPQQGVNGNVQSPQGHTMSNLHSGFVNNSCNILPSATIGQTPLIYSQSNTNASNVYNTSVNHSFSNPSQNFVVQKSQQPLQSHTLPQDQHSMALQPPAYNGHISLDQRHNVKDIVKLLKVYRDVKIKYLLLNRENRLLRQKMQSTSQDNSCPVKPPLISSLPNTIVPENDFMSGQVISQNSTVQGQPPSSTTHFVQTPALNVTAQNMAQPGNSLPSHIYPDNNSKELNQSIYAGFESGQMNFGSGANSTDQASCETLKVQDAQVASMVPVQNNNHQYLSNGNFSNAVLSQDVLHITSVQSLVQTSTASLQNCNPVHATNTGNFCDNKPLSSISREAITASLPLWKSVPQSSDPNKSGCSEPKHVASDRLDTVHSVAEIVSSSINEPTTVTLKQKSEHSSPNVSKGIAIVSPLVKMSEFVYGINQNPKVVPQGKDLDNANGVNKTSRLNKLFLALDSVDAADATKSLDASSPRNKMVSSLPCNVDQNSTKNLETVDDDFQISGICTLVEGNSFYDSSVAMMFEGSLQTQNGSPLPKTELKDDCGEDNSLCSASQATSSVSPTTETISVKPGPQGGTEPCVQIEDKQQGSDAYCLEMQPENKVPDSDAFDLEFNTASDQLSELLTEFPFGIKNYMSDDELKSPGIALEKFKEKPEIPKTPVPIFCVREIDASIQDTWREIAVDTTNKETQFQNAEVAIQQLIVEGATIPELPTDEVTSVQFEDDFEISDSPDANIHITILDQDEIPKLFPEDSAKPIVESEESVAESFAKAPIVDVAVSSVKEKMGEETSSVPEKELFCCLFSWLTHTNGNAPKCNCKMTEFGETEHLTDHLSQHPALHKTKASGAALESTTVVLCSSKDGLKSSTDGLEPFRNPCKTDTIRPPVKHPKLDAVDTSLKSKPGPCLVNSSPQDLKPKLDSYGKYLKDVAQKELRKNDTLINEKALQSKSLLEDLNSKTIDPSSGFKSKVDDPRKVEKLIIKTDFLKHKHSLKIKTKHKRKTSHIEDRGARSVKKINKNAEVGQSAKIVSTDRTIGSKTNDELFKLPAGVIQQSEKSKAKLKSYSSSDKSHSHSQNPSLGKHRGRPKSIPPSHFEKVKKVPTVQEYLERKRELCNKKSGPTVDQKVEAVDLRHRVEKSAMERSGNVQANLLKPLVPAKINVKTKHIESETINPNRKSGPRSGGGYEPLHKKHAGSYSGYGKGSLVSKGQDQKSTSSSQKIYLSPCDDSRLASYEGINLTKLQIRCSPEKPEYSERRKSLDSSRHSKPSKSETNNGEAPKMLEFKLCPEFVHTSPTTREKKSEPKPATDKSVIEGIKSKKEAWCGSGPVKKIRTHSHSENIGRSSPSQSTSSFYSSRPMQDSQTTFNAFKQKYIEQRSKSLDGNL